MFQGLFTRSRYSHVEVLERELAGLKSSRAFSFLDKDAVPTEPGIYLFEQPDGSVAYVGQAENLRRRVAQQFSGMPSKGEPTGRLVKNMLSHKPTLVESFDGAKEKVQRMTVRILLSSDRAQRRELERHAKTIFRPIFGND